MKTGTLYLLPTPIGNMPLNTAIPESNNEILKKLKYFIVEDIRTARRFIKSVYREADIDSMEFFILNKHTSREESQKFLDPLLAGNNMGLLSEAGLPALADPGSSIVAMAHQKQIHVEPLVGPSSITLALIASGMNGQEFCFHGYLPIDSRNREKKLREIETQALKYSISQIFIEAPYRNKHILESVLNICRNETTFTIACNIQSENGFVKTKTVGQWKKKIPDIHKKNTVFIIGQYML